MPDGGTWDMPNKTWRPVGAPGPGINEVPSGYDRVDGTLRLGAVTVAAQADGTITITLTGAIAGRLAGQLRTALVAVLLRSRPDRLILDLREVTDVDAFVTGTIVAGCQVADDCGVEVTMTTSSMDLSDRLHRAGLPAGVLAPA